MNHNTDSLCKTAAALRKDVLQMVHTASDGHPGPALSVVDILTALYFDIMKINPQQPLWENATS